MDKLGPCLHEGCRRAARLRGLCNPHYNRLQKRVQGGELTWEQAIARGLCAGRAPKGRGWMSGFDIRGRRRGS